jgi:hypothetical protein
VRLATNQRAILVSDAYFDGGRWYVDLDVHSEAGVFKFRITPVQGIRIAADLAATWRSWETSMKNPSIGR